MGKDIPKFFLKNANSTFHGNATDYHAIKSIDLLLLMSIPNNSSQLASSA